MQALKPLIKNFMSFAQERFGFDDPPKLFFKQDIENSKDVLGKTAYYDPQDKSVTVFITNRHPKDILRSLAHELVHHTQNLRGDLTPEKCGEMGPGYAQTNPHLREMERQAFEEGNLCFRDWSDEYKKQLQEVKFLKESKKMTKKITTESLKKLITKLVKEQQQEYTSEDAYHDKAMRDLIPKILAFAKDRRGDGKGAYINRGTVSQLVSNKYERAVLTNRALRRKFIQMAKPRGGQLPMLIATMGRALRTGKYNQNFGRTTDVYRSKPAEPEKPKKPMTPGERAVAMAQAANIKNAPDMSAKVPTQVTPYTRRLTKQQQKFNSRMGIGMRTLRKLLGVEIPKDGIRAETMDMTLINAIKAFQKDLKVKPDGVVGPTTAGRAKAELRAGWKDLNVRPVGPDGRPVGRKKRKSKPAEPKRPESFQDMVDSLPGMQQLRSPRTTVGVNQNLRDAPISPASATASGRRLPESKNLEEMGCGGHSPGKGDEKDRQGIIADEKEKKRNGVHRSTGKRCECGTPNCGGQNCTKMSEGKTEKCEKCANCGCKGKGCVKCDNCKDCNPVDKSKDGKKKDGKKKDGNKSTSKYDDNPKLKGGQANLPDQLQKGIIQAAESKIYTPEQEQELYESRFNDRNDRIFDKLKKLWTK